MFAKKALAASTIMALALAETASFDADETMFQQDECAATGQCNQVSMLQGVRRSRVTPLSGIGEVQPVIVHWIRHGDVYNPEDILYGRNPGYHLSEKGHKEASDGAARLQEAIKKAGEETGIWKVSTVFHSPMLRTRETAEGLTAGTNLSAILREEPMLVEVDVPYNGQPKSVAVALHFDLYSHGQEAEGFENYQDVLHRVVELVHLLRTSPAHGGTQVVAVTHGDVVLTARLWATYGLKSLRASGPSKPPYDEELIAYPDHVSLTTTVFDCEAACEKPRWMNHAKVEQ